MTASDLDHVLWIGGASGAGKTTVAGRLVRRWGLRLYSSDTRTWEHRDRAIAAGVEAAIRFEKLSPEERTSAPLEDRRAMGLGVERSAMVVEDLRGLPRRPLVVAEGTLLPASMVDPRSAVWLLPTIEFQARHRTEERRRDHPIDEVTAEAARYGIPSINIDGSRDIGEVVDEVERVLVAALAAGPVADDRVERRALLREANLAIVDQIRTGCARPWATADPASQVRTFVCECGDQRCDLEIELAVGVGASAPVVGGRTPPPSGTVSRP